MFYKCFFFRTAISILLTLSFHKNNVYLYISSNSAQISRSWSPQAIFFFPLKYNILCMMSHYSWNSCLDIVLITLYLGNFMAKTPELIKSSFRNRLWESDQNQTGSLQGITADVVKQNFREHFTTNISWLSAEDGAGELV